MKKLIVFVALIVCSGALAASLFHRRAKKTDVITLSEGNSVLLNLPITEETVKDVQIKLMQLDTEGTDSDPIYIVLNSPGGSIDAGMHLVETIQGLRRPVDSISIFSASMSFMLASYTRTRYVLDSATLMAHRASLGGVEGQIPGSFFSRANDVLNHITEMEIHAASRAGQTLEEYRIAVADELWLTGNAAIKQGHADKVTKISCDQSLTGLGPVTHFRMFIFDITVQFHKCPLIIAPVEASSKDDAHFSDVVNAMLNDRGAFVRRYIGNGKFYTILK